MHIASVGTALPPNRYSQAELIGAFEKAWAAEHFNPARVRRFHEAVQVGERSLALPLEEYDKLQGFGDANDAFLRVGLELADQAIADALAQGGLRHEDGTVRDQQRLDDRGSVRGAKARAISTSV